MSKVSLWEAVMSTPISTGFELYIGLLAFIWVLYNPEIIREKLRV